MATLTTPAGATHRTGRRRRRKLTFDRVSFMAVFLILPLAVFVVFVISPFVQALYFSMTDWTGFSPDMRFVGLDNFVRLMDDQVFLRALRNNVLLAIVVPFTTIVLALALATMLTVGGPTKGEIRGVRGSSFYRVVSFFPYTVPAIVIGLMWAQVFDPARGLLNGFLGAIGLDRFQDFPWLGDTTTAMPASMFVIIWSFVGFYAVLFVAAVKGVPAEMYEAARLDGAGRVRTAWSITIPQIQDNVQTAYIYIGIAVLDAFVFMQAMNPAGGPGYATLTMSQELYMVAFRKGQFGYATAMGVVLALVTLLFAAIVFLVFRLAAGRAEGGRRS